MSVPNTSREMRKLCVLMNKYVRFPGYEREKKKSVWVFILYKDAFSYLPNLHQDVCVCVCVCGQCGTAFV